MTTVDHRHSSPLPSGGSTGAFDDDASSESLGSSIPEFITLEVILPDGSSKTVEVNSGKQMIDLTVQLAASNRLSPANHKLVVYHPEHGRQIDYKASQMIGSLRVDKVFLVNKKADKDKSKRHTVAQPFEMTVRVTVNLPKNQKTVIRINPHSTLADVFKLVCKERNLDPYKHELRHPVHPDQALNMANTLSSHHLVEITVVNITAPDRGNNVTTPTSPAAKQSIYDTHWSYNNSMPRNKPQSQPPPPPSGEQNSQPSYMPGMTEKKSKRKSFLGFFSKKKEGKFNLAEANYNAPSTSGPPPTYEPPRVSSNGNRPARPKSEVLPQTQFTVQTSASSLNTQRTSTSSVNTLKSSTSSLDGPDKVQKPLRKKRQAPAPPVPQAAPPVNRPLSVNTDTVPASQPAHSQGSSHSSGFDEDGISPLESPGAHSDKPQAKTSIDTTSLDSSGHMGNGAVPSHVTSHVVVEESNMVTSSAGSTVSRHSSTGGESSVCSLTRKKKKVPTATLR